MKIKKLNKKAIATQTFLIILIIAVVTLILSLTFFARIGDIASSKSDIEFCKTSNEMSSIAKMAYDDVYQETKCPTLYEEITTDDDEEIKQELSDEMAKCWYKMGEGELNLFDTNIMATDYNCVVCSVAEFEGAAKGKDVTNFLYYMDTHAIPQALVPYFEGSYTEYMMPGYATEEKMQDEIKQSTEDVIDTNYNYATIFVYAKKGKLNKFWLSSRLGSIGLLGGTALILVPEVTVTKAVGFALIGAAAGAGAGYAAGTDDMAMWDSGVILIPYTTESLQNLGCEILPVEQANLVHEGDIGS